LQIGSLPLSWAKEGVAAKTAKRMIRVFMSRTLTQRS
jgi:hypothetical protein